MGNDLFAFKINYNDPNHGGTALFNGNIAETEWRTANTDSNLKWYRYDFDALDRMNSAIGSNTNYNVSNISYDKNGNILTLNRQGHTNSGATSFGAMDILDYDFDSGNKLMRVTDIGNDTYGFKDGTNTNDDFGYDGNGNITLDRNKGITSITYNHLNLPTQIDFGSDNIKYVYDADGIKLKKIISTGTTIDYADNYVYLNNELQFFYHEEGYIKPNSLGTFDYVYQYRDHVGNTRLSFTDANNDGNISTNEIIEENNFYPFGMKQKGYNNNISPFGNSFANNLKYQNQEFDQSFGYNMHEFELRHYDATIGRFVTTDPYGQFDSPYLAMGNNPVVSFDPDGGKCYDANGNKVACPDGEEYDEYRDSDKNHITVLDEVEVSVDNRPRMKPASAYDYSESSPEGKKEDDIDFILNGYETGMGTPIHRFFAILDRDLNADEDSQEMVEVLTVTTPLRNLRRTKHTTNRHVNKKKHPTKSKYKNPAQQKKLEDRTIKGYDKKTIQGNGRIRYEKTYDRVIGTRGEKSHTVVVDPTTRKIVTSFPKE